MVTAVSHAPLADVFGAFFIAPAIATLLAATILKERVTRLDIISLTLGLIGVLMVARPGAAMNVGLLWALGGGALYGCFNAATRWSAAFAPPLAQIAGQLLFGALFTLPFAVAGFQSVAEAPFSDRLRACFGGGQFLSGHGLCARTRSGSLSVDISPTAERGADRLRRLRRSARRARRRRPGVDRSGGTRSAADRQAPRSRVLRVRAACRPAARPRPR